MWCGCNAEAFLQGHSRLRMLLTFFDGVAMQIQSLYRKCGIAVGSLAILSFRKRRSRPWTRLGNRLSMVTLRISLPSSRALTRSLQAIISVPQRYGTKMSAAYGSGMLRESVSVTVVRTSRRERFEVSDPSNRESCTLIAAANAIGNATPPWLIFKTLPSESWAYINADENTRLVKTDTGFSNAEVTLDWIHDFNVRSWAMLARAQRSRKTLSEWFGCDEWLCDPMWPQYIFEEPPNAHRPEDRIY